LNSKRRHNQELVIDQKVYLTAKDAPCTMQSNCKSNTLGGNDAKVGFKNCFQPGNILPSEEMLDPVDMPNNTKYNELTD
jgi:hypothetical protein